MRFTYIDMGVARMIGEDDESYPIEGNRIYGVKDKDSGAVLGLVQEHPSFPNKWRAVAATDKHFPQIDFTRGLWQMTPGMSDFGSKREAAVWLRGAYDARQAWFKEGAKA